MADDDERYPVEAPGWASLDRAVAVAHRGQTPHQFTSQTAYDLESTNPLPAISVCSGDDPAHWHYITYGLTELFEKSSRYPSVSGFGFELTLTVPRGEEEIPPSWPLALLQGIGGHVLSGHGALDSGHLIDLGGPLRPEPTTALTGVLCVPDPRLGKIETPHGSALFMALFGLTANELETMASWSLEQKVGLIRDVAPLALTDPDRPALADDPRTAHAFRRAALDLEL